MTRRATIVFAHGKESGPWGTKITALAERAKTLDCAVVSPDFRGIDDPDERVTRYRQAASDAVGPLILIGSSMGGYVAAMSVDALPAAGLMLLAPALYFPGFDREPPTPPSNTVVIHGWKDDIVPPERAIRYAQRHRATLHMLDSGHTLTDQLPFLCDCLERVLGRMCSGAT